MELDFSDINNLADVLKKLSKAEHPALGSPSVSPRHASREKAIDVILKSEVDDTVKLAKLINFVHSWQAQIKRASPDASRNQYRELRLQTLNIIERYALYHYYKSEKEHIKAQLIESLEHFEHSGAQQSADVSINLGIGAAPGVNLALDFTLSKSMGTADTGTINVSTSGKTGLKLDFGALNFFGMSAAASSSSAAGTSYQSIHDWVEHNESNLVSMMFATLEPVKATKLKLNSDQFYQLESELIRGQAKNEEFLKRLDLIDKDSNIKVITQTQKPATISSEKNTLQAGASLKAGLPVLGAGVGASAEKVKTRWQKRVNLLDYLENNINEFYPRPGSKDKTVMNEYFYLINARSPDNTAAASSSQQTPLKEVGFGELKLEGIGIGNQRVKDVNKRASLEESGSKEAKEAFEDEVNQRVEQYASLERDILARIENLRQEYQTYIEHLNQFDNALKNSESKKILANIINEMHYDRVNRSELPDKNRNSNLVKDRGDFIRSTLMTYAMLRANLNFIYQYKNDFDKENEVLDNEVRDRLEEYDTLFTSQPRCQLDDQQLKKLTVPKQFIGKQESYTFSGQALGQKVALTYSNVETDKNLDNEGEYLSLSVPVYSSDWIASALPGLLADLEFSGAANEVTQAVLAGLQQATSALHGVGLVYERCMNFTFVKSNAKNNALIDRLQAIIVENPNDVKDRITGVLKDAMDLSSSENQKVFSSIQQKALQFAFEYRGDKDENSLGQNLAKLINDKLPAQYALQYKRQLSNFSLGASVSGIPVAGGATAGGGANVGSARNVAEHIGTNTLTYLSGKYNGFNPEHRNFAERWAKFKQENSAQLEKMLENICAPDSNIHFEFQQKIKEIFQNQHPDKNAVEIIQLTERTVQNIVKDIRRRTSIEDKMDILERTLFVYNKLIFKQHRKENWQKSPERGLAKGLAQLFKTTQSGRKGVTAILMNEQKDLRKQQQASKKQRRRRTAPKKDESTFDEDRHHSFVNKWSKVKRTRDIDKQLERRRLISGALLAANKSLWFNENDIKKALDKNKPNDENNPDEISENKPQGPGSSGE